MKRPGAVSRPGQELRREGDENAAAPIPLPWEGDSSFIPATDRPLTRSFGITVWAVQAGRAACDGGVNFEADSTTPLDIVVRQHDYGPGSSIGWHGHPMSRLPSCSGLEEPRPLTLPVTTADGQAQIGMLLVTRLSNTGYAARIFSTAAFISCVGARD